MPDVSNFAQAACIPSSPRPHMPWKIHTGMSDVLQAAREGDVDKQRVLATLLIDLISAAESSATIPCCRSTDSLLRLLFGKKTREAIHNVWNKHANAMLACLHWLTKSRTLDERRALARTPEVEGVEECGCYGQGHDHVLMSALHDPPIWLKVGTRPWSERETPIQRLFASMTYYMNSLVNSGYLVRYASDGPLSETDAIPSDTIILPYDAPTTVTSLCSWLSVSSYSSTSASTILVIKFINTLESKSGCITAFPALIPRVLVPLGLTSVLEAVICNLEDEYADRKNAKRVINDCATLVPVEEGMLLMDTRYIRTSLGAQADTLLPALDRFAYLCGIVEPYAVATQSQGPDISHREVYQRLSDRFSISSVLAEYGIENHPFYAFSFFRPFITEALRCANPSCTRFVCTLEEEDLAFEPCAGCRAVYFCTAACKAGAGAAHHAICGKLQAADIREFFDSRNFGYKISNSDRMEIAAFCLQNGCDVGLFTEIVEYFEAMYIRTPYLPTSQS